MSEADDLVERLSDPTGHRFRQRRPTRSAQRRPHGPLPVRFTIGGWEFEDWGRTLYASRGSERIQVTRASGSRAFLKRYPFELSRFPRDYPDLRESRAQAAFWLNWQMRLAREARETAPKESPTWQ